MLCNQYLEECDLCLKKSNVLLINNLGFYDRKHEVIQDVFLLNEWFIAHKSMFCSMSLVNIFLVQGLQALPKLLWNKAVLQWINIFQIQYVVDILAQ